MLLTNGIILLSKGGSDTLESLTAEYILPFAFLMFVRKSPFSERKEFAAFQELLRVVLGLESQLMASSEEEVVKIGELIQKGINGACADNTKGMKGAIINWITPKGQSLSLHIPHNVKFGLDKYPDLNKTYEWGDPEDPWNGLLCSGLLVSAYKHIFTSPSSIDQELKATHSRNACIHRMHHVTKASIAYVAMQTHFSLTSAQVFSCTDLITDSEQFYSSIMELLDDPDKSNEVDQLITWWNRQIFPLYTTMEQLPSKNSALVRICQKRAAYKELHDADRNS
ncbi:hypothetical protein BKA83DRAFT_4499837 [Pisolithus microcarpus]|nr:hypothetical protein BKA83DRAFT_4499837 [Pisolithus microcarpus]